MNRPSQSVLIVLLAGLLPCWAGCSTQQRPCEERAAFWIDLSDGEPLPQEAVIQDLSGVRVVYLGEKHTILWHHDMQRQIVCDLLAAGVKPAVGMEQMEACYQPILDEYNAGTISFEELAERTDWAKRWSNYEQYRPIVEAAHAAGCPVFALNAKAETVRAVAMQGVDGLSPELRAELPDEIQLDDPAYAQKLNRIVMIHARVDEGMLHRMFQAQVSRDETMAAHICKFLSSPQGQDRMMIVLCGSGHVAHGLGTPARVRRRIPGIEDRIIVMSGSGDVEISPKMREMTRHVTITHAQKRETPLPLADYLYTAPLAEEGE